MAVARSVVGAELNRVQAAEALPSLQSAAFETAAFLNAIPKTEVKFVFYEPEAKRVFLCGEFNGWSPDATPMHRQKGGLWEVSLPLEPGRHEYKFFVDGQWLPDPNAPGHAFNEYGTLNSVIEVRL